MSGCIINLGETFSGYLYGYCFREVYYLIYSHPMEDRNREMVLVSSQSRKQVVSLDSGVLDFLIKVYCYYRNIKITSDQINIGKNYAFVDKSTGEGYIIDAAIRPATIYSQKNIMQIINQGTVRFCWDLVKL